MTDVRPPAPRRSMFQSGLPLGRVLGVPVVAQPLWFVILVLFSISLAPTVRDDVPTASQNASYGIGLVFVLMLYGSVLLHEIGHVVVAKSLGMQVDRVVLQVFGGASEVVEEEPGKPGREFLVAAVGPLVSVLLGGLGFALSPLFADHTVAHFLVAGFGWTNAFVAAFNLLPGLPLDGGRVMQSVVWSITRSKARATVAAGWIGRAVAIAVALYGLYSQRTAPAEASSWADNIGGIWLLLLALSIWANANVAIARSKVTTVLPTLDLKALTRRALAVAPDLPVAEAVRRARDGAARGLLVVDSYGKPSGLVSEAAVTAMPADRQPWVPVSDVARPVNDDLVLRSDISGDMLLRAVQTTPATEYLVVEPTGSVLGILARTDLIAALQAAGLR